QYAPLVNACRKPGEWQTYDIIYHAPRFDGSKLLRAATVTVLHNGILVQDHSEIKGTTAHKGGPKYEPHPLKQPLTLQDHGNPVRFRNIWIRELGKPGKKEFMLPVSLLDKYIGKYENVEIAREDNQLTAKIEGLAFVLFAESPAKFFAKTTDV